MKHESNRIISPAWAQRIEVEVGEDSLLITGWGHLYGPINTSDIEPADISKFDLFQRLRLRQLEVKHPQERSGVYQFADATDKEKMIEFVRRFGPLWGTVLSLNPEKNGTTTLVVSENLVQLGRGQEIFAGAVKIVRELNRNAKADPAEIVSALKIILPPNMRNPGRRTHTEDTPTVIPPISTEEVFAGIGIAEKFAALALEMWHSKGVPKSDKKTAIIICARQALCDLLNRHAPVLVPVENEVIELPVMPNEGIMEALYFQLRLDFLAQRQIGTCLNCGGHFPVFRRGAKACSEVCRRALRNKRYWDANKRKLNRKRHKARTGRK